MGILGLLAHSQGDGGEVNKNTIYKVFYLEVLFIK